VGLQVVLETVVVPQTVEMVKLEDLAENGLQTALTLTIVGLEVLLVEQSLVPIIL
jgi:hypothetical protein